MEQCGNTSRWGVVIGIALLGVFLSVVAQAAVFTVNTPFDASDSNPGDGVCETAPGNGVCTLRAAIEETNVLAGDDTILLPPNTYLLTLVNELTITGNLTITGGGESNTIIDANRNVRSSSGVLIVNVGFVVSLGEVSIRNGGRTSGGGIDNRGTLTLTNSTVSANNANGGGGGGILNVGALTLTNSTVSGNSTDGGGGGITNARNGITMTVINSTVSGNRANLEGGGILNSGTANLFNATEQLHLFLEAGWSQKRLWCFQFPEHHYRWKFFIGTTYA